ncbi:glycosyltransferase family 87 protein [Salinilacihabitans rarus]|uniref:glycosyltransferase family 87 protein n=1 Tax=Salinilacihabitans rarus TaxID=2961596 RepID=UPI0020C8A364|nr:glycosyltransferase family 87 protein [Salinilacihabitans rarus]
MRRPLVSRPYVGAWVVLLWTVAVGQRTYRYFFGVDPSLSLAGPPWEWLSVVRSAPDDRLGVNYYVYHYAAEAALAGEDFYNAPPPGETDFYTFLYPPITVLGYVPFTALEPFHGYLVHTALTLVACAVATAVLVRYLDGHDVALGWIDVGAVFLFIVAGTHSTGTIHFGNVNLLLAAAILGGFVALERGRETLGGALFGVVALVKVFPTLLGFYLLRIRSWRGVAGAVGVGGGGLLASVVVFGPDTLRRFFVDVLLPRGETAAFVGGYAPDDTYYVTIQRPLSHVIWTLSPDAPATLLPVAALAVLAPVVGYCYLDVDDWVDRLVAAHATLVATIVFKPALRWYLVFAVVTWVALLYVWHDEPDSPKRGGAILAGLGVLAGAYLWNPAAVWSHPVLVVGFAGAFFVGLYAWYGDPVGPTFVLGGLVASVTTSPDSLLSRAASYPEPLATLLEPLYAVGTMQLYGLLLTLGACVLYKSRQGVGVASLLRAARTLRRDLDAGARTLRERVA